VVLSEAFAESHGFGPGDAIDATIHGRGSGCASWVLPFPEFVFELPPRSGTRQPPLWRVVR
jgi:hypothetical protein